MQKTQIASVDLARSVSWQLVKHSQRGVAHEQSGRPNEDAVASCASDSGILSVAVADGVGSGARGDLASSGVANHWAEAHAPLKSGQALSHCAHVLSGCEVALSNGLEAAGLGAHSPSGSMLVGAWLFPSGDVVLGHVGDCRAYRLHRGDLLPLTRDHSYRNLGLQHPTWRKPDDPARMIGGGMMGPPDVQRVRLEPGDWLLLCSDGLHAALTEAQLTVALAQVIAAGHPFGGYRQGLLQAMCRHLAKLAVRAGGRDDISVVLARFERAGAQKHDPEYAVELQKDASESVWPSDVLRSVAS